jgi:hypothetical protein
MDGHIRISHTPADIFEALNLQFIRNSNFEARQMNNFSWNQIFPNIREHPQELAVNMSIGPVNL